jgi:hypothetical protein
LDAFAAIELLTKKMQGISVPGEEDEEEKSVSNEELKHEEMSDGGPSPAEDETHPVDEADSPPVNAEMLESPDTEDAEENESTQDRESTGEPSPRSEGADTLTEMESAPMPAHDNASSATSLSLCERIDQVSISAASPEALQGEHASPAASPALSTSHSTARTAFALFSAHSRKRRVSSGPSSPLNEDEHDPVSPRISTGGPSPSRSLFAMSRPRSPTFQFPMIKKQKIWVDDEQDEPVVDSVSFNEASIPLPASPTGITSETPPSSITATPTKMGKRRRAIRGGSSSPELDEIDVEDPMVRVSKRHKL